MNDKVQLYPIETPPDDVLEAAWEQTPLAKLPKATKHAYGGGFTTPPHYIVHNVLPDDASE